MLKAVRKVERSIMTLQGELKYSRYILYPVTDTDRLRLLQETGEKSVCPVDEYLGVAGIPFGYTPDLALHIALTAICASSYDDAEARLAEFKVGADQARRVTDYVGNLVEKYDKANIQQKIANYDPKQCRAAKPGRRPKDGFTLYLEMDGAFFNTRGKNAEGSSYKETKLGIAFKSSDMTVDKDGNYHVGKREYMSSNEGVDVFREVMLALAINNGVQDASRVVILSDGAPWITNTWEKYFPFAIRILDLYHLKEKVGKFSFQIFKGKKHEGARLEWVRKTNKLLEDGKWSEVLNQNEVRAYKDKQVNSAAGEVNLYKYIDDNKEFIDYPSYKKEGLFVGSGAIDSGNKNVMQKRLKLSGMRWKIVRAQAIMALRCKLMSTGLWKQIVVPLLMENYGAVG